MNFLAQATLDDVVASVDSLYVAVSDQWLATMEVGGMVYTVNQFVGQLYAFASLGAFVLCVFLGWTVYGRLRRGRLFSH